MAAEVQTLSRKSDQAARDVGAGIQSLSRRIAEVLQSSDEEAEESGERVDTPLARRVYAIADSQRQLSQAVEETAARVHDAAGEAGESSARLTEETSGVMAKVQFQDITRQGVEHVIEALEVCSGASRSSWAFCGGSRMLTSSTTPTLSSSLHAGYVMHRQRDVHARFVGRRGPLTAGPDIELF